MILRAAWTVMLVLLATVVLFAQVDRSSRFSPELASMVPAPFRGFAQERLAQSALLAGRGEQAQQMARDLVVARPMAAENLTLLSQASALAGDEATALDALGEAASRGWREPYSQRAAALSALASDDNTIAAQRIAALLATGALDPEVNYALAAQLVKTADGRQALARQMAEGGYWTDNYVSSGVIHLPPGAYADVLARAAALNAELPCKSLERAAQILARGGNAEVAGRFWPGACKAG